MHGQAYPIGSTEVLVSSTGVLVGSTWGCLEAAPESRKLASPTIVTINSVQKLAWDA